MAGLPVFHQEKGKGAPLVLIHGFCETHEVWLDLAGRLAEKCRVLIPDLPGFGASKLPQTPFSLSDIASEMWHWLDGLGVQKPVLVGHSLGGYVALAMAEIRPDAPAGLGLFHSTATADSEEKKLNRTRVMDFVEKNGVDPFVDTFVPGLFHKKDPAAIQRVDALARKTKKETLLAYTRAMRDRPDRQAVLRQAHQPVLIVAGEHDTLIPLKILENQSKLLQQGHLEVLKQTGHMGMFEAPAEALSVLYRFTS